MTTWRERECTECKQVMLTASKASICLQCKCKLKSKDAVKNELDIIADYGYGVNGEPTKNKFGKRVYKLIAPCCNGEFASVFGNLISGIKKNEQSGYHKLPCGLCGPKHRMETALKGYVEKNGVDYDEATFKQYKHQVQGKSDLVYKANEKLLNPTGLVRGLAGIKGAYHLDHKTPIIECFKKGWTPEQASHINNLQMLHWQENLSKGSK